MGKIKVFAEILVVCSLDKRHDRDI